MTETAVAPDFDELPYPRNVSKTTKYLDLSNQFLRRIPQWLTSFKHLESLNLSKNNITLTFQDCRILQCLPSLKELILNTNNITSLTKSFQTAISKLRNLEKLDLSANIINDISLLTETAPKIKMLQLSGNRITDIPLNIANLASVERLYLGFNKIRYLPPSLFLLPNLQLLALNNNQIKDVPLSEKSTVSNLKTINLHNNRITLLNRYLVDGLPNLRELSLRGNPLVDKFVAKQLSAGKKHTPPTLFEMCCRSVKQHGIDYKNSYLPTSIQKYLQCSKKCPNPECPGVYFDESYEQVKFVDFCGAYRLPLMQFLCSPGCIESDDFSTTESSNSSSEEDHGLLRRRALLSRS